MPSWRLNPSGRRVAVAVGVPAGLIALAGSLTLATPAFAASGKDALPVPTSVCGTGAPAGGAGGSSASASAGASKASASARAGASASATADPSADASSSSASASASASPSPSESKSAADSANSPSPTPSPSASSSSSGGFWGWLNGVWTWIFGSAQLMHAPAAPAVGGAVAAGPVESVKAVVGKVVVGKAVVGKAASGKAVTRKAKADAGSAESASSAPKAGATCVPSSSLKKAAVAADSGTNCSGTIAAVTPWHLSTPSMTMYDLTYNGVTTVRVYDSADGKCDETEQVLDFTASTVTIQSMVTYSHQPNNLRQYVNGGTNETVTLTGVHLQTTSMTADVEGLLNLTFTPTSTPTVLLGLLQGLTVPLPLLFTNVNADNAFLNTQSITIDGFNGHGGPDS